jgi:hypothetical protein
MTGEQRDAVLDMHLRAPFRILRAVQSVINGYVKQAKENGRPVPCRKIVNISSIAGVGGNAGQVNYAAAKAGVTGLTNAEIGNSVAPPIPAKQTGQPWCDCCGVPPVRPVWHAHRSRCRGGSFRLHTGGGEATGHRGDGAVGDGAPEAIAGGGR